MDFSKIKDKTNKYTEQVKGYFKSLNKYEQYAWYAIGLGFVLVIASIILW
ncbi:hypothetical protein JW949_03370 [Candidatus Woesearchaeota archaeon]|nr:hypothetical protein [Candidatus Woesearchaeota archaeon]